MNSASVGIDPGKSTFHLVALDDRDKVIVRKKFSRPVQAHTLSVAAPRAASIFFATRKYMADQRLPA